MIKKRVYTTKGDIFSVKISETEKKYFQLIDYDIYQLNSDVIRGFKTVYSVTENPKLTEIVKDEVEFYAHCVTKWGIKMELWEKAGNCKDVGALSNILFRDTSDLGEKDRNGNRIEVSDKWYVWRLGDEKTVHVGKLEGENRKAEIGIIFTPINIVHKITTGEYMGFYPRFE